MAILDNRRGMPEAAGAGRRWKALERHKQANEALAVDSLARASYVAGPKAFSAILGAAQVISEQVQRTKVNRTLLLALSRRVDEFVGVLSKEFQSVAESADEAWVRALEDFGRTLLQIRDFAQEQNDRSYIVQFLQQQKTSEQVNAMELNLEASFQVLMLQAGIMTETALASLNERLSSTRILEDIDMRQAALSVETPSRSSRHYALPSRPAIHFGRASELRILLDQIHSPPPATRARVALLGTGGIGKTSLALSMLHHPSIVDAFAERRFFATCDAAESESNLAALVSAALGLAEGTPKALNKSLVHFLRSKPSILVLDNFESAWEPASLRADADALLCLLSGIDNLTLIITMRGSERPSSVKWTRPFIPPLQPLDGDAALQTFLSISNVIEVDRDLQVLVSYLDNLPLAVTLMAKLAQFESPSALLRRWDQEKTSMLSTSGRPLHTSNLDASIRLSLDSPRMLQVPDAQKLLALIAVLPDGVVEADVPLFTSHLRDNRRCLSVLLQNALIYKTTGTPVRLRVLAPIRAYMLAHHAPGPDLIQPLYAHYFGIADSLRSAVLTKTPEVIATVGPELGNMDAVIRHALEHDPAPRSAVAATVHMSEVLHNSGMWTHRDSQLLPQALEMARAHQWQDLVADCLAWAGARSYGNAGRWSARKVLEEAVEIYRSLGNVRGEIDAGLSCARVHDTEDGELAEAKAILDLADCHGEDMRAVRAMLVISANYRQRVVGHYQEATEWLSRALSRMEAMQSPDPRTMRSVKLRLADIAYKSGDIRRAAKEMRALTNALSNAGQVTEAAQAGRTLAHILLMQGYPREALPYLEKAVLTYHSTGNMMLESWCSTFLGDAHLALGNVKEASERYATATRIADDVGQQWVWGRGDALLNQARLALHLGDTAAAIAHAHSGKQIFRQARYMDDEARAVHLEGEIALANERPGAAMHAFVLAAVLNRKCGELIQLLMNLTALAVATRDCGDRETACRVAEAALPSLHNAGLRRWVGRALLCLANCSQQPIAETYARRASRTLQQCDIGAESIYLN